MAHFAELNENNVVIRVVVVNNSEIIDPQGFESEEMGIAFCQNLFGGIWKQTSYNGSFRKNFASPGFIYDEVADEFMPPST